MKKVLKRTLAVLVILALLAGGISGAVIYTKKNTQQEVMVIPVESLYTQIYNNGSNNLDGNVTTSVTQNVNIDEDSIIQEIFVQQGDHVKKGDKLIAFDMTLQEMEQNINKLTLQQQENDLIKAHRRLVSLQNGGPIEDDTSSSIPDNNLMDMGSDLDALNMAMSSTDSGMTGNRSLLLAAAQVPLLAAMFSDVGEGAVVSEFQDAENGPENIPNGDQNQDGIFSEEESGETVEIDPEVVTPSPEPVPTESPEPTPVSGNDSESDFFDEKELKIYDRLDENSEPYGGSGSEEDPYVFLCNADEGAVIATGAFINKMAGYDKDGVELLQEGGYWYRLEFYSKEDLLIYGQDVESMEQDIEALCLGYYLINGGEVTEPMRPQDEVEYTLENSTIPETEEPDLGWGGGQVSDPGTSKTREEAIKEQQRLIASLKINVRKTNLAISKLDKKLQKQVVLSTVDGVVKSVGDALTGEYSGDAFLEVESDEGYYIKGTISEMYLEEFVEGTIISGFSYETGVSFEAEVRDVSDYPVSDGSNYYGYGGTNSNASYYEFMAYVTDQSVELSTNQWLSLTFQPADDSAASKALNISQAFVRSENGQSYVYKDDNGVLKKQIVTVGGSKDGGYSVPVTSGISMSDKLAFPYGDNVKEGAKTREGTMDELYEMGSYGRGVG